jgi:predicted DNA-binding transcriptional regulator YafY
VRAARILDMLLLLQRRGRLTAGELSAALEVSERTILRDVEALSEAGVPIFTSQGSGGGIELMGGFETRLTGLTSDEAECLYLVGQPEVAHRLGLGAPARSVRAKLSGALSPSLAEQAESLSTWFVHDPDPWAGHEIPHGELRRIARSIRARRRVEIYLADGPPCTVEPLGLVLKAGSWHLVVAGSAPPDGSPTDVARGDSPSAAGRPGRHAAYVLVLDRLRATRLTTRPFEPPPDFSLTDFWRGYTGHSSGSGKAPRR